MKLEDRVQEKIKQLENIEIKELKLVVKDNPKAAKRPRKGFNSFYVPDAAKNKKDIQSLIKDQIPENFEKIYTDIEVTIDCYIKTLNSFSKVDKQLAEMKYIRPSAKPDSDNFAKTYLDALNGYLWEDDGQVISLTCNKYYSMHPRVELNIKYKNDFTSAIFRNRKNKKEN